MRRFFCFVVALIMSVGMCIPAFAADSETVTSYTEHYENIKRFLSIGETPDVTGGYVTFMLGGKPGKKNLTNDMLKTVPDTSRIGLARAEYELYDLVLSVNFMVLDETKNASQFKDVSRYYWGYTHINRCLKAGIFEGVSPTEFAINSNMTRAEFCQIIYNLYKNDRILKKTKDVSFSDVSEDDWFYTAVKACADAGIISGIGDGSFNPYGNITRQNTAIIMTKVIFGDEYINSLDVQKTVEAARKKGIAANDFEQTSDYAKKYMAASLGVIYSGDTNGNLNPISNISRTECATTMSVYFFDGYVDPEPEPEPAPLVYLSPSNQMSNSYTGVNTTEGKEMQRVAAYAKTYLEQMGYRVFIADVNTPIKDKNTYKGQPVVPDTIYCRAEEAYDMGASVYVAIHSNAIGGTNNGSAKGTMSFYNGTNPGSTELARAVHNKVSALTPTAEKAGAFQEDISYSAAHGQTPYAEVWRPKMANTLLEVEFHDYKPYAQWIVNNSQNLGKAIAEGIDEYLKSIEK